MEVPTTYDGEDLDDVARLWDMTCDEVVAMHTGAELVVAFCGFAPGFAYCTGLPERLQVPRLDLATNPRRRWGGGAGRRVHGHLPDRLAGGLAPDRTHRH